jgi:CHRD domain-containing protein
LRLRLISFVALLAIGAVPAVALATHAKELEFESYMAGKNEHPAGAPKGKATVNVKITGTKVCWKFTKVSGIDKPQAAHIHKGGAKVANGAVVVPFGAAYKATGCVKSTAAVVAGIARNPKGYYVNIHTKRYPAGAVRGQLHAGD